MTYLRRRARFIHFVLFVNLSQFSSFFNFHQFPIFIIFTIFQFSSIFIIFTIFRISSLTNLPLSQVHNIETLPTAVKVDAPPANVSAKVPNMSANKVCPTTPFPSFVCLTIQFYALKMSGEMNVFLRQIAFWRAK